MGQFELTFVIDQLPSDVVAAVYDGHDALYSQHGETCLLTVVIEGRDALAAAKAAVVELEEQHGVEFRRGYEDLVTKADIADRAGTTVQAVGQWARGVRHKESPFPQPHHHVAGGVWLWGEVNNWLKAVGKDHDEDVDYALAEDLVAINDWLRTRTRAAKIAHLDVSWRRPVTHVNSTKNVYGRIRVHSGPQKWTRSDYEIAG